MNFYDYHYHNNEHNHDNMNNQDNINNLDNINNHDNINNMIDKDDMNITVVDYDNGYNGIFTSVLLISFMTGTFIYIGNYTYLKLVDYFNRRYNNDNSLTENINIDKLDNIVVLNNLPENECCICLEKYKENDILIKLKCNHMFHKECLEPWFNNNKKSCPLCRFKLV
uniref:RING-type E3 ubiquitin transferase n=1 Tax=viral metagenome TaxID=1070528 RepID=A0A6C0C7A3_9ZZZZ